MRLDQQEIARKYKAFQEDTSNRKTPMGFNMGDIIISPWPQDRVKMRKEAKRLWPKQLEIHYRVPGGMMSIAPERIGGNGER